LKKCSQVGLFSPFQIIGYFACNRATDRTEAHEFPERGGRRALASWVGLVEFLIRPT
jgi:hypothetical protein